MDSGNKHIPIEFTGRGLEYFGIWIVNILLTIITIGIYRPWAKVRTRKYFYNNTRIDGSVFDYHANPVAILKGWLVVFAFLVAYNIISSINPGMGMVFSAVIMLMVPWAVVRSRAFNLRNTSYRNVRFYFGTDTMKSYKVFAIVGIPYVLFVLSSAFTMSFMPDPSERLVAPPPPPHALALMGITGFTALMLTPLFITRLYQFLVNGSALGRSHFTTQLRARVFYKVYGLAFVIAMVVFAVIFFGLKAFANPDFIRSVATTQQEAQAIVLLITIVVMLLYMFSIYLISAYTTVATLNEVWNKTRIQDNHFLSELRVLRYGWILLSNAFFILITLGLYTPWAKVRMMRYRVENLSIQAADDLNNFIDQRRDEMSALGEEMGDALDLEFGF